MKNKLSVGIFLLVLFFVFTFLISTNVFSGVDLRVTEILQTFIPRIFDLPFSLLSLLGSLEIVSIFILILWFIYRKLNIFIVLFSFAIFHVVELIGKAFVTHPGPTGKFFRYFFEFSFPSSLVKPGSSYPSGHLGRTMFLSALIIYIIYKNKKINLSYKKILVFFVVIFDILMFISRIYLGEHWLTDVAGGSILGSAMAMFALVF